MRKFFNILSEIHGQTKMNKFSVHQQKSVFEYETNFFFVVCSNELVTNQEKHKI